MRRNWLASAALATAAVTVPLAGVAGTAQAATENNSGQHEIIAQQKTASHRAHHPRKKHHKHHYRGRHRRPETFDQKAAKFAKTLEGDPYLYGGTTPAGFDCSGLTQYVYRHFGKSIDRTAEDQFLEFRMISHRKARPGDLVFFHDDSDPDSYVYHVGVYEGGDDMVAATTYGEGVQFQNFSWAGDTVTFGTITH